MAENNCPDETETKYVLEFCEYNTKDDNNENGIRKLNLKKYHYESLKLYIFYIYMKRERVAQWVR